MNVSVFYVGNIKDSYLAEGCAEYEKRIGAYAKLSQIELKEYKITDETAPSERARAMAEEGKRILDALPPKCYKIALCVEGKQMSSPAFSAKLEEIKNAGHSHIVFIIGGPFGLDERVKAACDLRLSLSEMTFSHRLSRLLLLEQIYRAFNIASGGNYHK